MTFTYSEFFKEIEDDLTLHKHDIDEKVYRAPNVHNKILRRFMIERNKLQKLETEYNKVLKSLYHHYRYEGDIRCENKDIAMFYVKSDQKYINIQIEYQKQELLVENLERWLKKADKISFDIKNIIEYLKWSSGI